jgi:hypothetical protein
MSVTYSRNLLHRFAGAWNYIAYDILNYTTNLLQIIICHNFIITGDLVLCTFHTPGTTKEITTSSSHSLSLTKHACFDVKKHFF